MQPRIVEGARHHGHRLEHEPVRQRLLFPEAEVAGAEQNALALREREPHALGALPLHELELAVRRQRGVLQQFQQQPPEVPKHRASDGLALIRRPLRKRHFEIGERHAAMGAVGKEKHDAETFAQPASCGERQRPQDITARL